MIQNFSDKTPLSFDLFPLAGKPIELQFSGGRISSDGGLLLLREVENQIGLIADISNCITDNRDQRFKALGGSKKSGLIAYVSADGIHWRK